MKLIFGKLICVSLKRQWAFMLEKAIIFKGVYLRFIFRKCPFLYLQRLLKMENATNQNCAQFIVLSKLWTSLVNHYFYSTLIFAICFICFGSRSEEAIENIVQYINLHNDDIIKERKWMIWKFVDKLCHNVIMKA